MKLLVWQWLAPAHDGKYIAWSSFSKIIKLILKCRMEQHLISCDCFGNPMRMVSYDQCTAENRGCRMCATGHYHDDMLGACVSCGFQCTPGFTSELSVEFYTGKNFSVCGPSISTSTLLLQGLNTTSQMQLAKGCISCPLPNSNQKVRYVASEVNCAYMCYRDTTGENTADDSYCATNITAASICDSFCKSCTTSIAEVSSSTPPHLGMYLKGCLDGIGYTWQDCDPTSKPANSIWTASTMVPGASKGCPWSCAPNTRPWNGQCLLCFVYSGGEAPCMAGQQLQYCNAQKTYATCQPCTGPLPSEFQAWTSDPPFYSSCR